ncbi:MAG: TldD/PmbA family protein [Phycisphaerales bacterium]|nr:MAG: TldD/PmbA family protein [Phycisphaerales bacterium]
MRPARHVVWALLFAFPLAAWAAEDGPTPQGALLKVLSEELDYSLKNLAMPDGTKPYFISYSVTDQREVSMSAELGAMVDDDFEHTRLLDVDVRVGDYELDNTHRIRGGMFGFDPSDFMDRGPTPISLSGEPEAIRHALWLATDRAFKSAAKKYQQVLTNLKTMVAEEDKADDFSREKPGVYSEPEVELAIDRDAWAARLRRVSSVAKEHPLIYNSGVRLSARAQNRYFVNSEGSRTQQGQEYLRVVLSASTKAEDGMELSQYRTLNAATVEGLPGEEELKAEFKKVIDQVLALREAPLVEPYTGPAILMNRASGVFFHEIFGHRIEGHRQKDVEEGQTFTKKVGEQILPDFISVHDDPTMTKCGDEDLRGYYKYDDEGVPAQDVTLVENGVLKTFLLSRSPVQEFAQSNGHGRRSPGSEVVSRMANTVIHSTKTASFDELRQMLIAECKKQDKPYGLLFDDITGGFTGTRRRGTQTFKVLPVVVYRVYPDGRPDELVRGVDIVGTPLTSFSKIIHTGDDPAVFNGNCGAESGFIPVSCVSPSILVSEIEVEKRRREQDKPPILSPPTAPEKG